MTWNIHEPRAVVAPVHLHSCRDVLLPDFTHAASSPYPVGFALYACREDHLGDKKPLPMFYVSPAVARDRSPAMNPSNAGGVVPGFYVIAQPETHFEVHVTKVNQRTPSAHHENRISMQLLVDGQSANHPMMFSVDADQGSERCVTGFVERVKRNQNGGMERTVRKFAFEKVSVTEEVNGDAMLSEAGSIRLSVRLGQKVQIDAYPTHDVRYNYQKTDVSEKEAEKLGRSMKVRCNGKVEKQKRRISKYATVQIRDLPEADVTVFVRKQGWMRSRRLIDDNEMPCTFDMYKKLLGQDNAQFEKEPVDVKSESQMTGHAAKRISRQSSGIVDAVGDDCEFIDLT